MSCCGGNCGCGSACKCGKGCSGCGNLKGSRWLQELKMEAANVEQTAHAIHAPVNRVRAPLKTKKKKKKKEEVNSYK